MENIQYKTVEETISCHSGANSKINGILEKITELLSLNISSKPEFFSKPSLRSIYPSLTKNITTFFLQAL